MSFNIGLTGIRAADSELRTTGNNIANASTVGFKRSRAEFGDVYASSLLGSASNSPGSGVLLTDVAQQFTQGNVKFTDNTLDLAINGGGFFILSDEGDPSYSRAGMFSTDKDGYLVNNAGQNLQGFAADADGNIINGVLTDLQVQTGNQAPQQTSQVQSEINLDATEVAPESLVVSSTGSGALIASSPASNVSRLSVPFGNPATLTAGDSVNVSFTITGQAPATMNIANTTINDANDLATLLNTFFATAPAPYNNMSANITGTTVDIDFAGVEAGGNTNFSVTLSNVSGNGTTLLQVAAPSMSSGTTSAYVVPDNGYAAGFLDVITSTGTQTLDFNALSGVNATARQIAADLNVEDQTNALGISASAQTNLRLDGFSADNTFDSGALVLALRPDNINPAASFISINPAGGTGTIQQQIVNAINSANVTGLSAVLGPGGNSVDITALNGEDIIIQNNNAGAFTGFFDMVGLSADGGALAIPPTATPQTLSPNDAATVGGELSISVDDGVTVAAGTTPGNLWGALPGNSSNTFDALDPETYNSATSVTVYDSLGNSHVMTQYFVKERTDPLNTATTSNTWSMYVLIDGQNVGNPPAGSTIPGLAQYTLRFNSDGTLDAAADGPFQVTNWTPVDSNGNYNGALGPNPSGTLPIPTPPVFSNFEIDITGSSQFGSPFSVNNITQNGFTTGRLTGLNVDDEGIIFARFTNGQAQVLGQVALAGFTNEQGMQALGDTGWAETFESGTPIVGVPQTAALGAIQSGALEESNVDISEELVQLIIAQRNYQSNAKTIETADQVTQTILNI